MNELTANNSERGKGPKPLIYVVDDEPMLLELACVILEPLGYAVKTFRDPETAVEAFMAAQPAPALIITDYAMHSMTGRKHTAAGCVLQPQKKIFRVSGRVDEHVFRDSPVKPDSFLPKPYQ